MVYGIDIGFGDVKVFSGQDRRLKFPTAVTAVKDTAVSFQEERPDMLIMNGKSYLVGESAIYKSMSTRSFSFLQKYAPLLAAAALKRLPGDDPYQLAIGLPIAFFTESNISNLQRSMKQIELDGQRINPELTIYPQGVGALLDFRLDLDGKRINGTDIDGIVVDIGFNTVDIACFEKGNAIRTDSAMLERHGVADIIQSVQAAAQRKANICLSEQEAKKAFLEGGANVYGEFIRLEDEIASATHDYVEALVLTLQSRWEERIQRADRVILAGGGAKLVHERMPKRYHRLITVPEEPEYANARGFYKAVRSSGKGE